MRQLIGHVSTDYVAFVTAAVIFLIFTLVYLYWSEKTRSQFTFPCIEPTDPQLGNLKDLKAAGGMHDYLINLHKKHGPVVGFWWKKELAVSLGSPAAWKDISGLFDRPVEQFLLFKPLIGSNSIQYANGVEGKKTRQLLDRLYSHEALKDHISIFKEIGNELIQKLKKTNPEEHIPLRQYMLAIAIKSILRTSFGDFFQSDKEIVKFEKNYDACFGEMEKNVDGDMFEEGSEREKDFNKALQSLKTVTAQLVENRRNMKEKSSRILLDVMLEEQSHFRTNDMIFDNVISYLVGGFHTTGNLLTWAIYYLTLHNDVQNKLYQEVHSVFAEGELTTDSLPDFVYLRQVIDETLRASVLAPWGARYSEYDIVIAGHVVPKETPLILPFGTVLLDPEIWPEPEKFDPDRFSKENKKKIPSLAFSPFGFAGKRKCPAYRFAYLESVIFLALLVENFKFSIVEGQEIEFNRGLVTQPSKEIWITVEARE